MVTVWEDQKFILWGGAISWSNGGGTLRKNPHLYELKYSGLLRGKVTFDVTKFAVPGTLAPSRQGRPPTEQQGSIPDGKGFSITHFLFQ